MLAKWIIDNVNLVTSQRQDFVREANALAGVYDSVAKSIDDGALTSDQDVIRETSKATNAALGSAAPNWVAFRKALGKQLGERVDGKPMADHAAAWREMAAGMRRAAKDVVQNGA